MNWIGLATFVKREIQRFLRTSVQTLVTPWISAILFIFIFGQVVGQRIDLIAGVPYIKFVLPGILMMNVISSSFSQASSSLYFQRFTRSIEEILVAPLSHLEMIIGYITGAVLRGTIVGAGILAIGVLFGATTIEHIGLFFFYIVMVSIVFGFVGLLIGLWANGFEQLALLNTFAIMPLSFLGGMFNSLAMFPEGLQTVAQFNPFFYFISGIRYAMVGIQESSVLVSMGIIVLLAASLAVIVWFLFKRGWRLRA